MGAASDPHLQRIAGSLGFPGCSLFGLSFGARTRAVTGQDGVRGKTEGKLTTLGSLLLCTQEEVGVLFLQGAR